MAFAVKGQAALVALCEGLGIPSESTKNITVSLDRNEVKIFAHDGHYQIVERTFLEPSYKESSLARKLLDYLDLDINTTKRVVILLDAGEAATMSVTIFPPEDILDLIAGHLVYQTMPH